MKQLKIDFLNMWGGFFKHDNLITNTLSLEYNVIVDENNPEQEIRTIIVVTSPFLPANLTIVEMCESHYGLCM